ncbi:unnamed protein product, partial [Ectocarpus sp. 13 AM-2016]
SSREATRRLLGGDGGGKLVYDYVSMVSQDVATVYGLVQGGAFLDWQDSHRRRTPLHRAVYFGHSQILKILLAAGANPNVADNHAVTPLHMVAVKGCEAEAAELLCAGADMHARTNDSYTPLHLAVVYNRIGVTRLLLDASASSLEVHDLCLGITPLAWASKLSFTTMLRVLLNAGADVNSRSPAGSTPLHWACRFNNADIVESLLLAGADPDSLDNHGADAGSLALSRARKDRTWRRRGWLVVVLARRQAMAMALGSTGGDSTRVGSGTGWTPERGAVEILLWLAAMEVGVFRNVMRYV